MFLQLNKKKFNFANFTSIYLNPLSWHFPRILSWELFSIHILFPWVCTHSQCYNSPKELTLLTTISDLSALGLWALPVFSTRLSYHHPWAHPISPTQSSSFMNWKLSLLIQVKVWLPLTYTSQSSSDTPHAIPHKPPQEVIPRPCAYLCLVYYLKLCSSFLKPHPTLSSLLS